MDSMPVISVVMSTHNTPENYLRDSIESVLNQTFKDFEFIIIDDGSTQNDVEIIRSYNDHRIVLLLNNHNKGLPYSLNRGIKEAKGKYIVRMDSDDISLPDRLKIQFDYMESHPEVDIGAGAVIKFGDRKGIGQAVPFNKTLYVYLFFKDCIIHPSVIIRKKFLTDNGFYYDETFFRAQDYELWMRVINKGLITAMPYIVLRYRCHEKQVTKKNATDQKDMSFIIVKREYKKASIEMDDELYSLHYSLVNAKPFNNYKRLFEFSKYLKSLAKQIVPNNSKEFSRLVGYYTEYNLIGNIIRRNYKLSISILKNIFNPIYLLDFIEWTTMEMLLKIKLMINYWVR